ncbi:MAG: hypothetical protein KY455_05110 [Euryarchaeota archaeon]|nr:hypothetical protein [Euryarchaeota archaeon]
MIVLLAMTLSGLAGCLSGEESGSAPEAASSEPGARNVSFQPHPVEEPDPAVTGPMIVQKDWDGRIDADPCIMALPVRTCGLTVPDKSEGHVRWTEVTFPHSPRVADVTVDWSHDEEINGRSATGGRSTTEAQMRFGLSCATRSNGPCPSELPTVSGHQPPYSFDGVDLSWFEPADHRLWLSIRAEPDRVGDVEVYPEVHVTFEVAAVFEVEAS